ncbi:unnamed protein product [Adineta ricciae]|uniref:G-protein coupled receptors family 1 profile domain-containing protein n=1 Tax=Adineta ricciae TaxID=249248 RepID=A0A815V4T7_ADIRI|nr:unnamed protein product [Adineta ricciae]CAF1525907.1 unnamed protein product [Adineta ricciae]
MITSNNFTLITNQPWFIPFDIINIISLSVATILAVLFLLIVTYDKACHNIPMMLMANSCLSELLFSISLIGMAVFSLQNDLTQSQSPDPPCIFRSYIGYVMYYARNYFFLLQSVYRYVIVVYPTRLGWQSKRVQILLVSVIWISSFVYALPHVLTNEIVYQVDEQICEMLMHLSWVTLYNIFIVYVIPLHGIALIYLKLVRYVKEIGAQVNSANTLLRAQRELRMVYRIVVLVSILIGLGIPYTAFTFMGFFTSPPRYHFRIALIFVNTGSLFIIIALFKFTDPVYVFLMKHITRIVVRASVTN